MASDSYRSVGVIKGFEDRLAM